MMDDLFASSAAPAPSRNAVVVPINNDVLLARFRVAGEPEQAAHGRVAQMLATLASRGRAGVTSAQFAADAGQRLDPQAEASARARHQYRTRRAWRHLSG